MNKVGRGGGRKPPQWRDVVRGGRPGGSGVRDLREGRLEDLEYDDEDADYSEEFVNDFGSEELQPKQIEEILYLNQSDHPGMVLVAAPLTPLNFLNWSRSIRRALAAKSKLELLDGTFPEPAPDAAYYKQWLRADSMISSWILNSISKELVNAFTHIESTRKL